MSENVYSRVLAQLVAKESSTQAVSSLLHVPEKTLQRWMLGRSQMPLRAFLRALDLVVQHEEREGALPPIEPASEPLTFRAGPVPATCAKCGHERFGRKDPAERPTYRSLLACLGCGTEVAHGDLIAALAPAVHEGPHRIARAQHGAPAIAPWPNARRRRRRRNSTRSSC